MDKNPLEIGKKVLNEEKEAILSVIETLDKSFVDAVNLILNTKGKLIITGMGKSGLIGKKLSATFSSTGTPAFFYILQRQYMEIWELYLKKTQYWQYLIAEKLLNLWLLFQL